MPTDFSTPQASSNFSKSDLAVPDEVIGEFLGLGLAYSQWQGEVKKRGYVWYPELENIIIKKEWEFFKLEIQTLRLEPKIAQSSKSKSNSLASILKRLKGEPWAEGRLDEREERLRTYRLLGRDAKIRCLQKYVRDWDQEGTSSASPLSVQDATAKKHVESIPGQSAMQNTAALEFGTLCSLHDMRGSDDTTQPDLRIAQGNVGINADTLDSVYKCPSQFESSMTTPSNQFDPFSATTNNYDPLQAFQNAVPLLNVEASGHYLEPEHSETFSNSSLAFGHNTTIDLFDCSPIGEDGVPTSADCSLGLDLFEPEPDTLEWLEMNQVLEDIDIAETEAPPDPAAFQETFCSPRNNFDENNDPVLKKTDVLEAGSTTENLSVGLARQHSLHQGCLNIVSQPLSPPRSGLKGRKRRRQDTSRASLEMPSYGNTMIPATSHVASDGDTVMSGYETSSQHTNEPVLQQSWRQLASPSGPLSAPPYSRMASEPAYTRIRTQVDLELELRRTKQELNSVRKQHQKDLDSFVRKQQAADSEISELYEKVQELQELTEHYEKLARDLLSANIVLQEAKSRKKSIAVLPTGAKEREHITKPVQSFSPSKNPRPVSLTLRPATASKTSSPPRNLSTSTLQDTCVIGLPIATSSSSRSNSPDKSQVSSEQLIPASSYSKNSGRDNRPGSADHITVPKPSISTRRDPNPIQHLMHKFSTPFLRKQYGDDSSRAIQPAPILPPLKTSVPLNREMAGVLVDGDKRLTNDSGYDSSSIRD